MLIPVEEKPSDEEYTALKEVAGNQTYGAQLANLQSTYNGLSDTDKYKSVIYIGGIVARYSAAGQYTRVGTNSAGNAGVITVYNVPDAKAYQMGIQGGQNPTFSEITSNTNSAKMILSTFRQP